MRELRKQARADVKANLLGDAYGAHAVYEVPVLREKELEQKNDYKRLRIVP